MSFNIIEHTSEQIAEFFNISSVEMGRLTGIKATRVRNMRAGKVQAWQPGECKTLMRVFGVRGEWLITGQGQMFIDGNSEVSNAALRNLQRRADALPSDKPMDDGDIPRFVLQRIKQLYELDTKTLAEKAGLDWWRVRNILGGTVKTWQPGECAALMRVFHVGGGWLCTGEGDMIQRPEDRVLNRRLGFVKTATALAVKAGLDADDASRLSDILMAVDSGEYKRLPALMRPPKK